MQIISGGITAPRGYEAAGVFCGIKRSGRKDLALLWSEVPARAVGVFTTNRVKAAPVILCQKKLRRKQAQAVIVNAGNANACTGRRGLKDAQQMARTAAEYLGIPPKLVLASSTGSIGIPLPINKIVKNIPRLVEELSHEGSYDAAEAIMTTDKKVKEIAIKVPLPSGKTIVIGAMVKGSGMIHPQMATTLAYITTDARVASPSLRKLLQEVTDKTFNMISVDGDTSTNDSVIVFANGLARNKEIKERSGDWRAFKEGFEYVCTHLAREIVRDGEGATKLFEIQVKGARTVADAKKVVRAVTNSSLVKTALYGEDINWGRIMAAVGYAGAKVDPRKVNIFMGRQQVVKRGKKGHFQYERVKKILRGNEYRITIDLGLGEAGARGWGCDLSYDYVRINAKYRT